MNLLPRASGSRPRVACEIAPGGVVAARSPEPGLPLAAVAQAGLAEGAVVPSLKPGNIADRVAAIAALRRVLEQVGGRPNARNSDLTLVIPDGAVRVLLLEFDTLPNKLSEALPLVRFRLKKLVPFEPDDAMVSFQVMSSTRTMVRVLAVAIPRDVLTEYESVAREAGFEPGAVLPSTLAVLAALDEGEGAALVVNAHSLGVTTAIARAGIVLLHRSIDVAEPAAATPAGLPAALFEPGAPMAGGDGITVDLDAVREPWAQAAPVAAYPVDGYPERLSGVPAPQTDASLDASSLEIEPGEDVHLRRAQAYNSAVSQGFYDRGEPAAVSHSPYLSPTLSADLSGEMHNSVLVAPTSVASLNDPGPDANGGYMGPDELEGYEPPVHRLAAEVQAEEIASAVSVAVAYFEDTLGVPPPAVLSAGRLGAESLERMLREQRIAEAEGLNVRELVQPGVLSEASNAIPLSWMAGVVGALKS